MKSILAPIALLVSFVTANFDIYQVNDNQSWDGAGTSFQWMMFESDPSCDQILNSRGKPSSKRHNIFGLTNCSHDKDMYRVMDSEDVSQGSGVVCEPPDQCYYWNNPNEVSRLEMNFFDGDRARFHWSEFFPFFCPRHFNCTLCHIL
jgi:hypothetical protein